MCAGYHLPTDYLVDTVSTDEDFVYLKLKKWKDENCTFRVRLLKKANGHKVKHLIQNLNSTNLFYIYDGYIVDEHNNINIRATITLSSKEEERKIDWQDEKDIPTMLQQIYDFEYK